MIYIIISKSYLSEDFFGAPVVFAPCRAISTTILALSAAFSELYNQTAEENNCVHLYNI